MKTPFGTVYIFCDDDGLVSEGWWELAPDGEDGRLEALPSGLDLKSAIRWGRARARRVLVLLPKSPEGYYWAGEGDPPPDVVTRVPLSQFLGED